MTFTAVTDVASEWAQYIAKYPDAAEAAAPDLFLETTTAPAAIIARPATTATPSTPVSALPLENTPYSIAYYTNLFLN